MGARKKIEIVAPRVVVGDLVMVPNYRRMAAPREPGIVLKATYDQLTKSWSYRVQLRRRSRKDNPILLYVSDDHYPPRKRQDGEDDDAG